MEKKKYLIIYTDGKEELVEAENLDVDYYLTREDVRGIIVTYGINQMQLYINPLYDSTVKTYGIDIDLESLFNAAEATSTWPHNCGFYSAVYYDSSDGKVWAKDEGAEDVTRYDSDTIFCVLRTIKRASPQAIMDAIKERLDFEKRIGLMQPI